LRYESSVKEGFIRITFALEGDLPSLVRPVAVRFERAIEPTASVKDAIERLGIPHTEVGAIELDGSFVGFDRGVTAGSLVRVWPTGAPGIPSEAQLGPPHDGWAPRFMLDVHLGTLARRLRLLGFDATYDRHLDDPALA